MFKIKIIASSSIQAMPPRRIRSSMTDCMAVLYIILITTRYQFLFFYSSAVQVILFYFFLLFVPLTVSDGDSVGWRRYLWKSEKLFEFKRVVSCCCRAVLIRERVGSISNRPVGRRVQENEWYLRVVRRKSVSFAQIHAKRANAD